MRLMNFWVENHKNFKTKQGVFFTHEDGTPFTTVGVYGPNSGGVKLTSWKPATASSMGCRGTNDLIHLTRTHQIRNPRMIGLLSIKIE